MKSWLFGDDSLTTAIVSSLSTLETGILLEDKLKALEDLKKMSESNPLEVGSRAMEVICDETILKCEPDLESLNILHLTLDILMNLMMPPSQASSFDEIAVDSNSGRPYYEVNMDLFLRNASNRLNKFMKLLSCDDFEVKYNIVQLLTVLLMTKGHKIRSEIINIYGAINTLTELLSDDTELLRNSMLVLLTEITKSDASISKLIAYDGAFEKVLSVADDEAGIEGGLVVRDCLALLHNLLEANQSNQKYFIEIKCVPKLLPLLQPTNLEDVNQLSIVSDTVDILTEIAYGCGFQTITQSSLGSLMLPLFNLVSNNAYPQNWSQSVLQSDSPMTQYSNMQSSERLALQQKCLLLLRLMLHGDTENQNRFLSAKVSIIDVDASTRRLVSQPMFAVIFALRLSLGLPVSALSVTQPQQSHQTHPLISILSEAMISSLFYSNRNLQTLFIQSFLKAQPHSSETSDTQSQSPLDEFGSVLLRTLSIWEAQKRGFGDPLRFWTTTRILSYILDDNSDVKVLALSQPLLLSSSSSSGSDNSSNHTGARGTVQIYFHDLVMRTLLASAQGSSTDQRIQLGLLSLLCNWCYQCREVIITIFTADQSYFQLIVTLANQGSLETNVYVRGLATFIVALCLEFARDLDPKSSRHDEAQLSSSAFLLNVISTQIGLERFKSNLEWLRNTPEYQSVLQSMHKVDSQQQQQQISANHNHSHSHSHSHRHSHGSDKQVTLEKDREKENRQLKEELFSSLMSNVNKTNRFKIRLFDRTFVKQFENIFATIDQRMISLLSKSAPQSRTISPPDMDTTANSAVLASAATQYPTPLNTADKPPLSHQTMPLSTVSASSPSSTTVTAAVIAAVPPPPKSEELESLQRELQRFKSENSELKVEIREVNLELQTEKDRNEKLQSSPQQSNSDELQSEMRDMRSQNQLLSQQNSQLKQALQQMQQQSQSHVSDTELQTKLSELQRKFDELTEQNNDLLVYLGHLHSQSEKMQTDMARLRAEKEKSTQQRTVMDAPPDLT